MFYLEIIVLAFALAVDAVVVSFSYGLVMKEHRFANASSIATITGFFQGLMPAIGFLLTGTFFRYIEAWDHWIGFAVFFILGILVIYNALMEKEGDHDVKEKKFTFKLLLLIGIATSIDALVAGASIYFLMAESGSVVSSMAVLMPALVIAGVTFICAFTAFRVSSFLHHLPTRPMEVGAGLVLIFLGVRMLYLHMS